MSIHTASSLTPATFFWGGTMEVILNCENFEECSQATKTLKNKLDLLYASKNINKILKNFKTFTEEEINYLNSPLLDEIAATITKKHPLIYAFKKEKKRAIEFYVARGEVVTQKIVKRITAKCEKKENWWRIINLLLPYSDVGCSLEERGIDIVFTNRPCFPPVIYDWFLGNHGDYTFYYITKKEQLEHLENSLKKYCESGHSNDEISVSQVAKIENGKYRKELEELPKRYGSFEIENWYCLTVINTTGTEVVLEWHQAQYWFEDKRPCSCHEKYLEKRNQFPI